MPDLLGKLRRQITSASTHIALATAMRGTVAGALPLIGLQLAGYPDAALPATLGAVHTSLTDTGGPYRARLIAMGLGAAILPVSLFAGTQVQGR
jgi:hypothetical protein